MTLSDEHEEIVDDIREILVNSLREKYPEMYGERGFSIIIEAIIANLTIGLKYSGLAADMYIVNTPDDCGPIMVEAGRVRPNKWKNIFWKLDGRPIRVLKVDFDRTVGLTNKRHTKFEEDLLTCLEEGLLIGINNG